MIIKAVYSKLLIVAAIGVSVCVMFFVITCAWIGYEAKQQCLEARRQYEGDCVEALISLLNDQKQGFRDRNDAIWALGQMGDSRALPSLKHFYTGNIPERESLYQTISQYELKKAINLAQGGVNISAYIWRGIAAVD